jgi:N-acetylglucosaminyldiphosphoundecaprenol N-acetyl-beta-D-mannosaminyltransferase
MNRFFDYKIYTDKLNEIDYKQKNIVSTLNPYSFLIAEKDKFFKRALQDSDILLPDGQGIVWAEKFLYGKTIKKIAGYDLFYYLVNQLNDKSGKCFFLGSKDSTLLKIKNKIKLEFPRIIVESYSPPFKDEFNEEDNSTMIQKINKFKPDVLFVGMTAPKQEKWVFENKDKLNVNVIASIGAVFDFYAGNVQRPSQFWIKVGLEWLIRFLQEPRRLFKRNLYSIVFISKILTAKWKSRGHLTTDNTD